MSGSLQSQTLPSHPVYPSKHLDPETGIFPISEWGSECARGWVCDTRFARGNAIVIKQHARKKRPPSARAR